MKILVTGGRDFTDRDWLFAVLDKFHQSQPISQLIHGAAKGADSLADDWAKSREISCIPCPADWKRYGRRAGFLRNRQMLRYKPDLVIAFPGGNGTKDMVDIARVAGIRVEMIV